MNQIYIYIYIIRSIRRQQLFRSLRAHKRGSDQIKILKDQSAHTTTRAVGVAIYIHIYIYKYIYIYICMYIINFKAINNVLDAKMVLKTHFSIKMFRLVYRSFVFTYISMYIFIYMAA